MNQRTPEGTRRPKFVDALRGGGSMVLWEGLCQATPFERKRPSEQLCLAARPSYDARWPDPVEILVGITLRNTPVGKGIPLSVFPEGEYRTAITYASEALTLSCEIPCSVCESPRLSP